MTARECRRGSRSDEQRTWNQEQTRLQSRTLFLNSGQLARCFSCIGEHEDKPRCRVRIVLDVLTCHAMTSYNEVVDIFILLLLDVPVCVRISEWRYGEKGITTEDDDLSTVKMRQHFQRIGAKPRELEHTGLRQIDGAGKESLR